MPTAVPTLRGEEILGTSAFQIWAEAPMENGSHESGRSKGISFWCLCFLRSD